MRWGGNVCSAWINVWWWTGPYQGWIKKSHRGAVISKISIIRGAILGSKEGLNPLLLTVRKGIQNPWDLDGWSPSSCTGGKGRAHGAGDVFYLRLGVDISGRDPMGDIRINLHQYTKTDQLGMIAPAVPVGPTKKHVVEKIDTNKITFKDKIAVETGYVETNFWLNRVTQYAQQSGMGDCWVCARGRPTLQMTRSPYEEGEDEADAQDHMSCGLELMMTTNPSANCGQWERYFPLAPANVTPPAFRIRHDLNATCYENNNTGSHTYGMGWIPKPGCRKVIDMTRNVNATKLTVARADIWWYCGGRALFNWLPANWKGRCTLITLNVPVFIASGDAEVAEHLPMLTTIGQSRHKRSILMGTEETSTGVWIDSIGQARNIPDEYKLADEVAAGFESFPLFMAIFPITVNKNVNRINLIHYNVQRLANLTRDIAEAVHQQLAQTSLMTLQNRVALDMLLAEKGGVCAMFGDLCCTSIANNTAPDGSLSKGLTKLRALANELKAQSGVSNPMLSWLQQTFGRWGAMLGQIAMGLFISVSIFVTCGCCCIPCIRTLVTRTIEKALSGRDDMPPKYQALQMEDTGCCDVGKDTEEPARHCNPDDGEKEKLEIIRMGKMRNGRDGDTNDISVLELFSDI